MLLPPCRPVYPIVRIDTSSADGGTSNVVLESDPPVADPGNATQVNAYNYNQTVFAIGGTSQPFCAFPITSEIAQMVGAEDVANEVGGLAAGRCWCLGVCASLCAPVANAALRKRQLGWPREDSNNRSCVGGQSCDAIPCDTRHD
jgi:hypothetical protein